MQYNDVPYLAGQEEAIANQGQPTTPSDQVSQEQKDTAALSQRQQQVSADTAATIAQPGSWSPQATEAQSTASWSSFITATSNDNQWTSTVPTPWSTATSYSITSTNTFSTLTTSTLSDRSRGHSTNTMSSSATGAAQTDDPYAGAGKSTNPPAGQVAGIVAGSIAAAAIMGLAATYLLLRKTRQTPSAG
ncbi:hypothetical protein CERZMDRAFT_117463 [Cercospora zeae-maydis SCOH1-5]|uniref:Uncharacterized protein n=1 Tax=Cercospora zeae-maydis SCOH1-5 TaxID=717836 RepID=A0A6A6FJ73_9PEZI|nr:hypothetical protein CERZMDRAFT_117463 [Cercospora zeae-maydis SCOH1-5]